MVVPLPLQGLTTAYKDRLHLGGQLSQLTRKSWRSTRYTSCAEVSTQRHGVVFMQLLYGALSTYYSSGMLMCEGIWLRCVPAKRVQAYACKASSPSNPRWCFKGTSVPEFLQLQSWLLKASVCSASGCTDRGVNVLQAHQDDIRGHIYCVPNMPNFFQLRCLQCLPVVCSIRSTLLL